MIQYQAQQYGRQSHNVQQQQAVSGRGYFQPGVPQHASVSRSGLPHQSFVQQGYEMPAAEKTVHLDRIIASNKNMRDASLIDIWLNQSIKIMQRVKLDPLPEDKYTETSEAGTDLSQAYTANDVFESSKKALEEGCMTPPDSPPWRAANEGGMLAMEPPPGARLEPPAHFAHQHFLEPDHASTGGDWSAQGPETPKGHQAGAAEGRQRTGTAPPPPPAAAPSPAPAPDATKQVTLGVTLGKGGGEGMAVLRVKDGGVLALHGGLQVGDRVVKIDGEEVAGLSAVELNKLVVGPEGSVADIRFLRAAAAAAGATAAEAEQMLVTRSLPSATRNKPFGVVRAPAAR